MSARNLSNFAESAMAVNRVIQQHFSMNYSYMERPPPLRCSKSCYPSPDAAGDREPIPEEEVVRRCADYAPLGLSPPGESQLLRRRLQAADKPLSVR